MTRLVSTKVVVILLLSFYSSFGMTASDSSTIDFRITDHKAGIEDFKKLFVGMESVSLHKTGNSRSKGWLKLLGNTALVDIVPLKEGRFVSIGSFEVPAGEYDAIRIEFSDTRSEFVSGIDSTVTAKSTTIAKKFDLMAYESVALVVDLYAENLTDHKPESYAVKVKEIRLKEFVKRDFVDSQ